ncbi:MAG: hypothetical protein ACYCPW_10175 [Nitrososphaerales archaeon]
MNAIADTSSIIHPAKVPSFWRMMKETFEEILIPEAVHGEILKGKDFESSDVPVIEQAITDGWIKISKTKAKLEFLKELGAGERQAITLAMHQRESWLLMDDEIASRTARSMGLSVHATSYLPIYWTRKGVLKSSKALEMLDDLTREGYRLSSKDYVRIKERILSNDRTKE